MNSPSLVAPTCLEVEDKRALLRMLLLQAGRCVRSPDDGHSCSHAANSLSQGVAHSFMVLSQANAIGCDFSTSMMHSTWFGAEMLSRSASG